MRRVWCLARDGGERRREGVCARTRLDRSAGRASRAKVKRNERMLTSAIHLPALGLDTLDVPTVPFHPNLAFALDPVSLTLALIPEFPLTKLTLHHPTVDTATFCSHPVYFSFPVSVSLATSVERIVSSAAAWAGTHAEPNRRSMGHATQLAFWRSTGRSTREAKWTTEAESFSGVGARWRAREAHGVARRWFAIDAHVSVTVSVPVPIPFTVAITIAVATAETGDAFASWALYALLVRPELVLEFAHFFFVLAAHLAMLVFQSVERGANDVEFVHLAGDWQVVIGQTSLISHERRAARTLVLEFVTLCAHGLELACELLKFLAHDGKGLVETGGAVVGLDAGAALGRGACGLEVLVLRCG